MKQVMILMRNKQFISGIQKGFRAEATSTINVVVGAAQRLEASAQELMATAEGSERSSSVAASAAEQHPPHGCGRRRGGSQ